MVDHFNTYLYQKRGFYYFSRRVPQEIHKHFPKHRIVLALNTRSHAKALKCAQVICQRLDERWLPMRLDALGLGNVVTLLDVKPIDVSPYPVRGYTAVSSAKGCWERLRHSIRLPCAMLEQL